MYLSFPNKRYLFSHSSGYLKSKISIIGLKSGCQDGGTPSGCSKLEPVSCVYQL
jgi:hypothetical protein